MTMRRVMEVLGLAGATLVLGGGLAHAQSCQPQSDQIAVYMGQNFTGSCGILPIGDYRHPTDFLAGIFDDDAESIIVGSLVEAPICFNPNYGSPCFLLNITGGWPNLNGWNNQVSSIQVRLRAGASLTPLPSAPLPGRSYAPGTGSFAALSSLPARYTHAGLFAMLAETPLRPDFAWQAPVSWGDLSSDRKILVGPLTAMTRP
jgi:hypothetical protein